MILIVQLFRRRLPQTFAFHSFGTCNYSFRRACFVPLYWDALYPPTSPSLLVFDIDILMIAYIALFSALLSRLTALTWGSTRVTSFITRFLNIHRRGVLTVLTWLVPRETAAISAQILCTPYNHAPCHFMQSHICKVYVCLAVTCHLHFWRHDRGLLRATVVPL